MKAHIVGGGFGGLAAAALLIRNANVPGQDITIYEADGRSRRRVLSRGKSGRAATICQVPSSTRNSAAGSICSRRSPRHWPTRRCSRQGSNSSPSTTTNPYNDQAHILDGDGAIVHGPPFRPKPVGRARPRPGLS